MKELKKITLKATTKRKSFLLTPYNLSGVIADSFPPERKTATAPVPFISFEKTNLQLYT